MGERDTPKRVRLRDVANLAGVSVSTASQALNGGAVGPESKRRVEVAASRLGYVANAMGKSLRTGRANQVGMWIVNDVGHDAVIDEGSPVLAGLVLGVIRKLGGTSLTLQVQTLDGPEASWSADLQRATATGAFGGLIVAAQWRNSGAWSSELRRLGVPLVVINDHQANADACVAADNPHGVRLAVEHLHSLGHRRVGCIAGPSGHMEADLRLDAFYRAIANLGCHAPTQFVRREEFSVAGGYAGLRAILADDDHGLSPTAVVCSTDTVAAGALRAAAGLGLEVPRDLSLVGFDDSGIASVTTPALTTIHQSHVELGRLAAVALLDAQTVGNTEKRTILMPVHLVLRESTGPVAGNR